MTPITTVRAVVNEKPVERIFYIRAANAERILYDTDAKDDKGNPVLNCAMSPAGFAARTGWRKI